MGLFLYRFYYFFREAGKNLRQSPFLTVISVSTIAVSLILVGFFATVLVNANRFLDDIASDLRISIYVTPGASPEAIEKLLVTVGAHKDVEDVQFVSREEDRERSRELLDESLLAGLDEESLPAQASLEVSLRSRKLLKRDIEALEAWLATLESVETVDRTLFGADKLRVIHASIDLFRVTGIIISVILVFAAIFFTFSTIKLAIFARQDEIEILRLVGATGRFIRVPFYIEGFVQGVVGSFVAFAIILLIRGRLNVFVRETHFLNLKLDLLPTTILVWFFVGGIALGLLGSALSIGRHLRS